MNKTSLNAFKQFKITFSGLPNMSNMSKRWAGHSKWQNIKSTKEAQDRQRSINFQRIRGKIVMALKDGGNDSSNFKLKSALEEARKYMMPKETVQNIIKSVLNKEYTEPTWLFYSNFKGIILGFEIISNPITAVPKMNQYLKKIYFKQEKNISDIFNIKGLIISEPIKNIQNYYEKAIEHGIEAGISEVTENENNMLYFECEPEFVQGCSKKLASLGYNIQSATTEIEFFKLFKLNKDEKQKIEEGIKKLQLNFHDIVRIVNNIEEETNSA